MLKKSLENYYRVEICQRPAKLVEMGSSRWQRARYYTKKHSGSPFCLW